MDERDTERAEAVGVIAAILAAAYLRLRFPELPQDEVDYAEKFKASCDG